MGRRDAARVPGRERRSPSVPGGGWTGGSQAASQARGAAPLPLFLPSFLPRLSRGSSSPAAPRRTWLHPPPPPQNQPAGQCGHGRGRVLGPGPLGERAGLPWRSCPDFCALPPASQATLVWFCSPLSPAPRSSLTPLSAPSPWSITSSHPLPSPRPRSAASARAGLSLRALTGPLFVLMLGPLPASEAPLLSPRMLSSIAAPSEAQVQSDIHPLLECPLSLPGWQVRAWRPPYSCPRLPRGRWGIKKGGFVSKTTGSQRRKSWPGVSLQPNPFTISGGTKQVPGETATSGRREGEGRQGLLESRDQDEAEWPSSAGPDQRAQAGSPGARSGPGQWQSAFKGFDLREVSALAKSGGPLACCLLLGIRVSGESFAGLCPRGRGFINTTQHP